MGHGESAVGWGWGRDIVEGARSNKGGGVKLKKETKPVKWWELFMTSNRHHFDRTKASELGGHPITTLSERFM